MLNLNLVHLSTVHPRNDIRIFVKQVQTLNATFPQDLSLVVADGLGDSHDAGRPAIYDLGKIPAGRFKRAVIGNLRAFAFLRRAKPHLVHFHDPELIPLGLLLRVLGCQVVYDVHEDVPRQTMSKHWIPMIFRWPVAKAMAAMEWLAGTVFSGIVPATSTIAARFPAEKTVLVQNFPIQAELVLAEPLPYDQRRPAFAYVGGLADIRGATEMVQAFEYLNDRPEAVLEIAGVISPEGFADELRQLPGWSRVSYHEPLGRSEVARLLAGARAGLVLFHPVPNHTDAQPNKMFEYMSAGLPVIASDFPLWREIIAGADCGLLVDPLDPKAIADALCWILDHPVEAEAMGKNGQKAVKDKYNWEQESKKLVGLYCDLLKTKQVKE